MKELALLLNEMKREGVVSDYALFDATAQMRYTEPVATLDADVLVVVPEPDRLDVLSGIYGFCLERELEAEGEAIRVGAWPVQFVPVFSPLTTEAVAEAETADYEGAPFRVARPDYLAVLALSVGRGKDFARVLALLESGAVTQEAIASLAERHGLLASWRRFEGRFLS